MRLEKCSERQKGRKEKEVAAMEIFKGRDRPNPMEIKFTTVL